MMGSETFMKVTNKDIYNKIIELEEKNNSDHETILIHQQKTNGRVTLNKWIATTAITLIVAIGGVLGIHLTNVIN